VRRRWRVRRGKGAQIDAEPVQGADRACLAAFGPDPGRPHMNGALIVGLDLPTVAEAEQTVRELEGVADFYKIGYRLVFAGGLDFARDLVRDGKKVFLDMKLLDIDNTVAEGVENVAKMGVSMLTLHAYPKAMRAAVEAARGSDLCLLGVTVLTS